MYVNKQTNKMGKDHSRFKPEDFEYLVRNTDFTAAEIQKWYKDFLKDYPNGEISIEQFKMLYGMLFPRGDASTFAAHVFRTLDTNCDGVVDFREFTLALQIISHGTLDEKLKWVFTMYDIDGNGYITCQEMMNIVRSVHKAVGFIKLPADESTPEKRTAKIFREMNKKMDERISLDEFIESTKDDPVVLSILRINSIVT